MSNIFIPIMNSFCSTSYAFLLCSTHLSTGQYVPCQFDLGKVSLADGFEQTIVADVWLLIRAGSDGVPAPGTQ